VSSEVSAENFDKFEEEEPFFGNDGKNARKGPRKFDMHFIGYTYKADVENEKSMLVNVLKDLDSITESHLSNHGENIQFGNTKHKEGLQQQIESKNSYRDMSRSSSEQQLSNKSTMQRDNS
jgi:hypothetical protein